VKDPALRLGSSPRDAEEILEHPWFSSNNWEEIINKKVKAPYIPQLEDPTDVKHFCPGFT